MNVDVTILSADLTILGRGTFACVARRGEVSPARPMVVFISAAGHLDTIICRLADLDVSWSCPHDAPSRDVRIGDTVTLPLRTPYLIKVTAEHQL